MKAMLRGKRSLFGRTFWTFLVAFAPLAGLVCILAVSFQIDAYNSRKEVLEAGQYQRLALQHQRLEDELRSIGEDLLVLAAHDSEYAATPDLIDIDFTSRLCNTPSYISIGLADPQGHPLLLLTRSPSGAITSTTLFDRAQKEAVSAVDRLPAGTVYASEMMAFGDDYPSPMVQMATRLLSPSSANGAVVVLKVSLQGLIDDMDGVNVNSRSHFLLLGRDGISHTATDRGTAVGRTPARIRTAAFSEQFKDEWATIANSESTHFATGNGLFSSNTVHFANLSAQISPSAVRCSR